MPVDLATLRGELATLDTRSRRVRDLIIWYENEEQRAMLSARAAPRSMPACSWCGDTSRTQHALMRVGDRVWRVAGLRVCSLYTSRGCRAAWLLGQSPADFQAVKPV